METNNPQPKFNPVRSIALTTSDGLLVIDESGRLWAGLITENEIGNIAGVKWCKLNNPPAE